MSPFALPVEVRDRGCRLDLATRRSSPVSGNDRRVKSPIARPSGRGRTRSRTAPCRDHADVVEQQPQGCSVGSLCAIRMPLRSPPLRPVRRWPIQAVPKEHRPESSMRPPNSQKTAPGRRMGAPRADYYGIRINRQQFALEPAQHPAATSAASCAAFKPLGLNCVALSSQSGEKTA